MFTQGGCGATGFLVRTGPLDPFLINEPDPEYFYNLFTSP